MLPVEDSMQAPLCATIDEYAHIPVSVTLQH